MHMSNTPPSGVNKLINAISEKEKNENENEWERGGESETGVLTGGISLTPFKNVIN